MEKDTNLPETNDGQTNSSSDGGGQHLYVDTLNYNASDLTELRKLAATNPDLAKKVLDLQDRKDRRKDRSYRLGLVFTCVLAIVIICSGTYLLVNVGLWQALAFVCVLLGISHVLRAILKGEFSDTSWFGKFLSGAKTNSDES